MTVYYRNVLYYIKVYMVTNTGPPVDSLRVLYFTIDHRLKRQGGLKKWGGGSGKREVKV
jgi:hypothetical protein